MILRDKVHLFALLRAMASVVVIVGGEVNNENAKVFCPITNPGYVRQNKSYWTSAFRQPEIAAKTNTNRGPDASRRHFFIYPT